MSETKWTPGPWLVHGPSSGRGRNDDGGDYAILKARMGWIEENGHRYCIAEAIHRTAEDSYEPAEANAHLVAACPSLYAELERTVDALEALKKVYGATVHLEDARAALARARGEQP